MAVHAFDGVAFTMAHVGHIHRRHGIVGQHGQPGTRREPGQRLARQHGGQRAFKAAQVQRVVHAVF
jgi:hypothetical protein